MSVVVGRNPKNKYEDQITLADPQISRDHARFEFVAGNLTVTDIKSRNGTYLERMRLEPGVPYTLENGDELQIGIYRLRVKIVGLDRSADLLAKTQAISLLPFDEFEMIGEIARGGNGSVWKVRHKVLGVFRAIKILHEHTLKNPSDQKRFEREARIAASIHSDYIVQVIDARVVLGKVYLVMEYIHGRSLQELRSEHPFTLIDILEIFHDVACALRVLLEAGIVHRDVKPANVLIDHQTGRAKLTDFGIARPFVSSATIDQPQSEGLGTMGYVAPEQAIEAESADQRSDIYGLGATMYFLVSGASPHKIRTVADLRKLFEQEPIPLKQLAEGFPDDLCSLVMRMIAKNPDDRPQGPSELIRALERLIQRANHGTAKHPTDRSGTTPLRGHRTLGIEDTHA